MFAKTTLFFLHPLNFEIQKQIIKFDDIGNAGHEKMPDIPFSGLSGRARKTRVWKGPRSCLECCVWCVRYIIHGGERYGSSHYITIVWHCFWICKAKLNQDVFILMNFHPFSIVKIVLEKVKICQLFLFSIYIYLNDLHDFLNSSNIQCLSTISEMFETFKTICHSVRRWHCIILFAESSEE